MSAILSADDLNDFISPGVACIKPVETLPPSTTADASSLETEVILDGQQPEVAQPAKITLTDCLACSGCVTSAEAVLVSLQSHSEVLNTLDLGPSLDLLGPDADGRYTVHGLEDESRKLFVASVSPQSRASLAATCGRNITEKEAGQMIQRLLMGEEGLRAGGRWHNGFAWVFDTNAAREACLVLGSDEVLNEGIGGASRPAKPILTSSCPGWVCYAEKTHPYVLPHLSRVKSPQALMGTLIKSTLSKFLGISPDRIWHLAVMPCFDKKLEASREELTDAAWARTGKASRGVRDVDCVITSKEVLMLAESRGINFFDLASSRPLPRQTPFPDARIEKFLCSRGSSHSQSSAAGTSGGYLYFILQEIKARHPGSDIQTTKGRNADVVEYTVTSASGEVIFKAAKYYGFRNIQNLVRKLKPASASRIFGARTAGSARRTGVKSTALDYAYVEVMACPGGCTNGGGQIKVDDPVVMGRRGLSSKPGPSEQKEWLSLVDEAYFSADESEDVDVHVGADGSQEVPVNGISPSYARDTLAYWASTTGIALDKLVYTSYREVVSDVGKDKTTDTERVIQLASKVGGGW
ncbi:hypothetical protein VTK73DRAFT_9505 [Phialemonium thermophilum]|uniref:Nuclear architecture-related protein 1 n=1 Tax=Phialemonium thermophilum TaxID=223376 RepID=A0ABR3Y5P9_9PEZI